MSGVRLNARSELEAGRAGSSSLRQILLYIRENRMRVAGLICPTRHALYDEEFLEPRLDLIRRSMSLVRSLETEELLVRCGRIPDPVETSAVPPPASSVREPADVNPFGFSGFPKGSVTGLKRQTEADRFSLLCEIVNDLAKYGNHVGCTLNLMVAAYRPQLISKLLSNITCGPVRIVLDPATAVMTGESSTSLVDLYRSFHAAIGYVRARDAIRDVDGAGVEVAVGDGNVDWLELLLTMEDAAFTGWTCIERTGGDHRREDVVHGLTHLRSLIPQRE